MLVILVLSFLLIWKRLLNGLTGLRSFLLPLGQRYFITMLVVLSMSMVISLFSFPSPAVNARDVPFLLFFTFWLLKLLLVMFVLILLFLVLFFLVPLFFCLLSLSMQTTLPLSFLRVNLAISAVFDVYCLYEKGSGARLNLSECEGFWLGSWSGRFDCPVGISLSSVKITVLGVFRGPGDLAETN